MFYILRNLSMMAFRVYLTRGGGVLLEETQYEWLMVLVFLKQIGIP